MAGALGFIEGALADLARAGLLRTPVHVGRSGLINLCSNDYLGYARKPWPGVIGPDIPSGAGASRLVSGDHEELRTTEAALAGWVGAESALLFSSGYAANVGCIA